MAYFSAECRSELGSERRWFDSYLLRHIIINTKKYNPLSKKLEREYCTYRSLVVRGNFMVISSWQVPLNRGSTVIQPCLIPLFLRVFNTFLVSQVSNPDKKGP